MSVKSPRPDASLIIVLLSLLPHYRFTALVGSARTTLQYATFRRISQASPVFSTKWRLMAPPAKLSSLSNQVSLRLAEH